MIKNGFLIDMDGVIYRGEEIIPGGKDFIPLCQGSCRL